MKNTARVLVILVLLGGLVCGSVGSAQAGLSKKKSVELQVSLIDVKADTKKEWYILYLENHKAVKVPPDGVTIKISPHRVSEEPRATLKGREYYVEKYSEYDEVTFVFKDQEEYLKYLGDIRDMKLPPKDQECFIATAAYGTPLHEDLDVLRRFRDNTLKKNWLGQKFVGWYYENGPAMAKWVAKSETRRSLVRSLLIEPAVFVLKTIEKQDFKY